MVGYSGFGAQLDNNMRVLQMTENTEMSEEKCRCANPPTTKICKIPFYDAFSLCLICSHTLACHTDGDGVEVINEASNK